MMARLDAGRRRAVVATGATETSLAPADPPQHSRAKRVVRRRALVLLRLQHPLARGGGVAPLRRGRPAWPQARGGGGRGAPVCRSPGPRRGGPPGGRARRTLRRRLHADWFFSVFEAGIEKPHTWWIQPLLFAGALGAKEHAIVYPALLLLAALAAPSDPDAPRRRWAVLGQRRFWGLMLVLGAVGAGFVGFRAAITGGILEPVSTIPYHENPLAHLPFWSRLPASLGVFGYAVSRLFWPAGLSPDYSAVSFPLDAAGPGRGVGLDWPARSLSSAMAS